MLPRGRPESRCAYYIQWPTSMVDEWLFSSISSLTLIPPEVISGPIARGYAGIAVGKVYVSRVHGGASGADLTGNVG